jgi:hypothetical protein
VYKTLPPMRAGTGPDSIVANDYTMSGLVSLLPFYEQQQIYDYAKARNFRPAAWRTDEGTWTVRIPTLLCPSDEEITLQAFGNSSYKFCVGTVVEENSGWWGREPDGCYNIIGGIGERRRCYGFRDIRDGTSNTIAMSERRIGNNDQWWDIANVAININSALGTNDPNAWWQACWDTANIANGKEYNKTGVEVRGGSDIWVAKPGERWAEGRPYYAAFNTILAPNGPSCIIDSGDWEKGVFTASSRHPTIVNGLLGDGSVRQIAESIDLRTWRGLGTRGQGETLGDF